MWAYFMHFGGRKMRIVTDHQNHDQHVLAFGDLILSCLAPWNCGSFRFALHTPKGYLPLCEFIFCTLVACICESWGVSRTTQIRLPSFWWGHLIRFGGLKVRFVPGRQSHNASLPGFVWAHFLHFGVLKMLFMISRESHGASVPSFVWAHFL